MLSYRLTSAPSDSYSLRMALVSTALPDGPAIKRRRELAGLRQAELAALVDRHPQTISDVERGVRPVSVLLIGQIARVLKVNAETLIKADAA